MSPEAVAVGREQNMEVVDGACPFMFLSGTPFFHRLHGFFHRVGGKLEA